MDPRVKSTGLNDRRGGRRAGLEARYTIIRRMPALLRAFRHPNYRLFFAGQAVSMLGMWLHWTAQSWLVYRLTKSAAAVGLVTLALQGPGLLLGPIGGAYADRFDKRRLLIVTQASTVLPAALLGVLTLSGRVVPWHIAGLALVSGIARAFELPTRQAFIHDLVGVADLPNAIALNSALFNGARLIGPALAGLAIPLIGEGWCFLANAAAYLTIVFTLFALRLPPARPRDRTRAGIGAEILEGLRYVRGEPTMVALLGALAVAAVAGMPYTVLLPSFAARRLGGGPETFGYLQAAVGLGAIAGALTLAARTHVRGLERWVATASLTVGALLLVLSRAQSTLGAVLVLIPIGFAFMIQLATTNTLLQTLAPDHLRGRVMSLHTSLFLGVFPLAGLGAGALADRFGEAVVMLAGGSIVILGSAYFGRSLLRTSPRFP